MFAFSRAAAAALSVCESITRSIAAANYVRSAFGAGTLVPFKVDAF